ncbi:MAG: bifunctional aminoglycoside phosphotransferase/ATP-binding protein [Cyanobium sp.]
MDALVPSLLQPEAYAHPVDSVRLLETHISWVFLTGSYAYKVKKPVCFGFVDFSTAERRRHCCAEELRLNRRLAPELYLDVVTIHGPAERACLHGSGPPLEVAVRMREFRQEDLLPEALNRQTVAPQLIDGLAGDLARFHASAAAAAAEAPWGSPELVLEPLLANLEALQGCSRLRPQHRELRAWLLAEHQRQRPLLEQRRAGGCIRECHGDLHLGNMVLRNGRITVFDGIEFSDALRWIDPISDLAFLLMDLRHRRQHALAARLLQGWLEQSGDHAALPLLPWYEAYRALVRAKVAGLRLAQPNLQPDEAGALEDQLNAYLSQACQVLLPRHPALLLTHGVSGCGKSYAAALLRERGWLHLRSDGERLRLFGRWGCSPVPQPPAADPYAEVVSAHLYDTVLAGAAAAALDAGLAVVVDATFLRRNQRQRFRELARRAGAGFGILAPEVGPEEARRRIAARQLAGDDPSEADASVLEQQLQRIEPLSDEECGWRVAGVDDARLSLPCTRLPVPG